MSTRATSTLRPAAALVLTTAIAILTAACAPHHPPRDRWHALLGPNDCAPQADEDTCWTCIRGSCCTELYTCESSAACKCWFPCRMVASRSLCERACDVREVPAASNTLATCANDRCAHACSERSW